MPKSRGYRHKTGKVLKKRARERGLQPLGGLLIDYKMGDQVVIDIDPSHHKAMPHKRFQGKVGRIVGARGRAYVIEIDDIKKTIITTPEHIKPLSS